MKSFQDTGYICTDNSPVSTRSMPGYKFDPTLVNGLAITDDNYDDEERIDTLTEETLEEQKQLAKVTLTQTKQLTLINMWKNKN